VMDEEESSILPSNNGGRSCTGIFPVCVCVCVSVCLSLSLSLSLCVCVCV